MRPSRTPNPPRLAELLLRLALPRGLAGASIKGDLDQEFEESLADISLFRARVWYFLESLRFVARFTGLRLGAPFGSRPHNPRSSGDNFMSLLLQDTRFALRRLLRSPMFSLVAVLTLAIGIGANTAIFSLVNGILLKPLPFEEAESLISVRSAVQLGPGPLSKVPIPLGVTTLGGISFSRKRRRGVDWRCRLRILLCSPRAASGLPTPRAS